VAAFGAFCAVSSTVYLLNDLLDLEQDRQHPEKRHRPLASGRLRVGAAVGGILVLLPSALWASFRLDPAFGWIVSLYFAQNLLYTKFLKHVVILDVMLIAVGFVLRAISGPWSSAWRSPPGSSSAPSCWPCSWGSASGGKRS
jgi:4-hydroxybenzoate polyprenyltransferase